ncbi:hypothetical protein [Pseudonocardia sp. T1-2H]|uniref:hypothetical protein n=1 Tax=Pseudonocardia sp. T1-2H TaxID=3128899 RepID=UPI003100E5E0
MLPIPRTAIPALPDPFVPRSRLLAALQDDDSADIVLVSAPAGFGKTVLLAHWARAVAPATPLVWVDLAQGADDAEGIWRLIVTALTACPAVPAGSALHELGRRGSSPTSTVDDDVLSALDALPVQIVLVLHDVHEVVAPAALAGLGALLAARPAGLRLVLCSRRDPPLSLGPLRSVGQLREVRAARLRFTVDETGQMLRRAGLHLDGAQVREAHACTGGWPTGVRLLGAALRRGSDPTAVLERFAAALDPMADFLVREVLEVLPAADRDLLDAIGGGPVTPRLAALLSGRSDADEVLERLTRETGLVQRVSHSGFRVHPLVPAHVHIGQVGRTGGAAALHGRAGHPGAAEVDPLDVIIRDALQAGDAALLVEVVHRFAGRLLATGGHAALGRVLSRLGERAVADDPWLALCSALARIETGREPAGGRPVPREAGPTPAVGGPRLAVLRSITGLFAAAADGDLDVVPDPVDLRRAGREIPEWAALALTAAGGRAMLVDKDPAAATAALEEALGLARAHGFACLEMQCLALLGSVAGISGDYPAMTRAAARADALATAGGWQASPLATAARWMLAYGALMRGEPVEAHRLAGEALRRGGPALRPRYVFALRSVRGAALFDAGQRRRGLQQMQQARADLGAVHLSAEQAAALAVVEHKAASELGLPEAARGVVGWLADRIGACGEVVLMQAWAEQAAGRDDDAAALVGPVLDGAVRSVLPHTVVEALLVEASGRVRGGDVRTARRALRDALSSGVSLGVVRPFMLAAGHARELLDEHLDMTGTTTARFTARAVAAGRSPEHRATRLDDLEARLLARLPSSLSMEQIAEELRMPPTDVSTGVRAVYRKLGVSSRRTAVSTAYERGLLR